MSDTWFEVQWLVPADKSISGEPYWTTIMAKFDGETEARGFFEAAMAANNGEYRLCRCTREPIAAIPEGTP